MFQSTHPRGVRRFRICPKLHEQLFQSTHPRGVRPCDPNENRVQKMFQSTHPRGVRPTLLEQAGDSAMFQSTHPRGVRPLGQVARDLGGLVSIHAPAWGATLTDEQHAALIEVSIHAPAWGATKQDAAFALKAEFQSTHPRGVRHGSRYVEYLRYLGFNPRTRVGCDIRSIVTLISLREFQSTHPRGVRHL